MNRGLIAEKRGQWEDGERAYEESLAIAERFHLTADIAEVQFLLARLRFKTRDLPGARAALKAAAELKVEELRPQHAAAFEELKRQLAAAEAETAPSQGEHPL